MINQHLRYYLNSRRFVEPLSPSNLHQNADNEEGLTLIECIVALVIIALTVGSVTPALVISVATRVQSQKAEQAIEIAQAEIDAVRTLMERGTYTVDDLPAEALTITSEASVATYTGPVAGTTAPSTTAYSTLGTTTARAIDVDGDGATDFGIQVYRTPGTLSSSTSSLSSAPIAFTMGVRVYDIRAITAQATGNLAIDEARIGTTGGDGDRSRQPLATIYTTLVKGDTIESYCRYIEFLGSTPSVSYNSLGCS